LKSWNNTIFYKAFLQFFFQGGRGYFQEVWENHQNRIVDRIRKTYNATYPVKSVQSIKYGVQDYSNTIRYEERFPYVNLRYEGFLRPPYSGMFRLVSLLETIVFYIVFIFNKVKNV